MTHRQPVTVPSARRLAPRLAQLLGGAILIGVAVALLVHARLGLLPLDVLHAAISSRTGWTIGGAIIATQAVLLAACATAGLRPGIGAVAAAMIPALVCDAVMLILPPIASIWARLAMLLLGGAAFTCGIALHLSAGLGALPRDGLILKLHRRRGWRLGPIRLVADVACLAAGSLLIGPAAAITTGTVGLGSVLLAACLGPLIARLMILLARTRTGRIVPHADTIPTVFTPDNLPPDYRTTIDLATRWTR